MPRFPGSGAAIEYNAATWRQIQGLDSDPPAASNWTAYNSATIADYPAGGISIARTISGSINLRAALISQSSGNFTAIARIRNVGGYIGAGICVRDSGGSRIAMMSRTVDSPSRVLVVAYSNSSTYASTPIDKVHRTAVPDQPLWHRLARSGTTLTWSVRVSAWDDWVVIGTTNDTSDLGFTGISHIGICGDPNIVGSTAEAVVVCDYWSRT